MRYRFDGLEPSFRCTVGDMFGPGAICRISNVNRTELQALLATFRAAEPVYPFGPEAQVWKVGGKIFAIVGEGRGPQQVSVKCDPELAMDLRDEFPDHVSPGYHLNKKHWNTVLVEGLPDVELMDWIEHSYDLVAASLPARLRSEIAAPQQTSQSDS